MTIEIDLPVDQHQRTQIWGFCDVCGTIWRGGERSTQGYTLTARAMLADGWGVMPYLELYCPAHKLKA